MDINLKRDIPKHLDTIILLICITAFIIITIYKLLHHIPWRDEAHAYNIARYLSVKEIFGVIGTEGHPFVWFLILKPFAKLHLWYPYPMQIINYLFFLSALILFWIFAPFNKLIKILITFSYPFLNIYPIVARNYSIGILGLFLLVILFRDKMKHPVIYSIIIFITGNTSVMAMGCASAFALFILPDLFKGLKTDWKKSVISLLILFSTMIIILLQYQSCYVPDFAHKNNFFTQYNIFLFDVYKFPLFKYLSYIIIPISVISFLLCIRDNKKILLFTIYGWLALNAVFFFVYAGNDYHFFFLFIYFIIFYWLYLSESKSNKFKDKFCNITFILLCLLICFKSPVEKLDIIYRTEANIMAQKIEEIKDIENTIIYTTEIYSTDVLPYIKNKNIKFKHVEGHDLYGVQAVKDMYVYAKYPKERFLPQVDKPKTAYVLTFPKFKKLLPKKEYKIEPVIEQYNQTLYKITPKHKKKGQ